MKIIHGQSQGVEYLTPKDGLSQGFIFSLLQDKEGFIWAATKNGLNRYDGYRFEVFTHDPYDPYTLSDNTVTEIQEFEDYIIVKCEDRSIQFLNKYTHKVYRLHPNFDEKGVMLRYITSFFVDARGTLWINYNTNQGNSIYSIMLPEKFWTNNIQERDWQDQAKINHHKSSYPNAGINRHPKSNAKIIISNSGFYYCNEGLKQCNELIDFDGMEIINYRWDDKDNLWVSYSDGSMNGVAKIVFDKSGSSVIDVVKTPVQGRGVRIIGARAGYLWMEVDYTLKSFKLGPEYYFSFETAPDQIFDIPEFNASFFIDKSEQVWIGTRGFGLIKINPRSKYISKYFEGLSVYGSIYTDSVGNIITREHSGLLHKSIKGESLITEQFLQESERHIYNKSLVDSTGNIWILGVKRSNALPEMVKIHRDGKISTYPFKEFWSKNLIFSIDKSGSPFVATTSALIMLDTINSNHILYDYGIEQINSVVPTALVQTSKDQWFLGTTDGLMMAKIKDGKAEWHLYKNDSLNSNSLRSNDILSLLPDPVDNQILWIGTNGGGLNRLNLRNSEFKHFTKAEGFPNDVIYGILSDDMHNLWMSSNSGIIVYSPNSGRIRNYTSEDGTTGYEFNRWAHLKSKKGLFYFGGVSGLTVIDPALFSAHAVTPNVVLNSILINGKAISWNKENEFSSQENFYPNKISIPYTRNNITFGFAVTDYFAPKKNRFRYYLQGAEAEWTHESSENSASYLNLKPGTYIFRVLGSNSDGIWSENPAEMMIIIQSPWYATWWAYALYLSLLGSATIAFFRLQVTRKLASAEAQRLKTLDDIKSKFFANISHEFRTPLTVILGTSEQLEEDVQGHNEEKFREKALRKTTLIRRNGENLLRLINQILDLSKLESSIIKPSYIHGDVVAFLKYIAESLQSLAESEGIVLKYETEVKSLEMDYDPERLLQIVHNLLSNAIKFTPSGGQVLLIAGTRTGAAGTVLSIEVADTGAGIPPEDQKLIFDRFYQAGNQQLAGSGGTGIGLALAKELVLLMGGGISLQSPDLVTRTGSRFTVLLPIKQDAVKAHRPVVVPLHEQELFHERHPDQVPSNKKAPHLLLIEDNPDVMEYLNICLSNDYVLDFAYNGVQGIEKAFEIIPDLILSDVMMPGKDGFEVCETLKNDIRTSHIPIILLTARASVEDRIMGLKRGADAYLAKPFQREELMEWIRQLIARREILRSRYADSAQDIHQESASTELELEDAFIVGLRAVLASHFTDDKFAVNDLAREMKMSRTQVHRKLSALYGGSTTEFVNSFRLEKAKEFLESGDYNVSEAAFASGFGTAKYFSRLFQEKYGVLPNVFLKK